MGWLVIAQILTAPPNPQPAVLPWLRIVLGVAAIASVAATLWLAMRRPARPL